MSDLEEEIINTDTGTAAYIDNDIITLSWNEHIQRRPGMYIGKLGDGTNSDDGIYVLIKEVVDNSIDEYMMGFGKVIDVNVTETSATIRDYGRGIPLGSLIVAASKMNTGAKYDSEAFKKSVGLNGVGIKAVNALSSDFEITAFRDGQCKRARFSMGELIEETPVMPTDAPNGTLVSFTPSAEIFKGYIFRDEFIVPMMKNYTFLNTGLKIHYNGKTFISRHGLMDLLQENMTQEPLYPPIHLKGDDIEVVITVRRGILLVCQRPAYNAGRHTSGSVQGIRKPYAQGIFQQEFRVLRHSQRYGSRHRHTRAGPGVRIAD